MKKIRLGLIGCNYMGKMHADCYRTMENVEVVAVADLKAEVANAVAKNFGAKVFTNGMELIESCQLDALDICLPTFLHTQHALKAMDKIKYIFIEKPVALIEAECDSLLEKQRQTGAQVQVGHVIRFWDEYSFLRDVYTDKRYGELINMTLQRISPSPTWGWNSWMQNTKLSGGAILDLHIHDLDYMLHLFGQPNSVHSVKNVRAEQNSYVATICQYDGFAVSVEGTWYLPQSYPFNMYYRAVFEKAVVELDGGKVTVYDETGSFQPDIPRASRALTNVVGNISETSGYMNELRYFITQATANKPIEKATLQDGVASLKFILQKIMQQTKN